VKIYSATGELIYEESSAPGKLEQMIQSIRALAGASPSITVTEHGFEPAAIIVPRGVPVTLRFHRKVEKTCATEVIMTVDGKQLRVDLPLDKPVEMRVTFPTAGAVEYGCAMDHMVKGTITVR
jgi:plastocyanin domain-containing protein